MHLFNSLCFVKLVAKIDVLSRHILVSRYIHISDKFYGTEEVPTMNNYIELCEYLFYSSSNLTY
jgi:hypothetical protein